MSSHPFGRSVSLNRRGVLAAASIFALLGARPAAARQDATPAGQGEWTFVDDYGVTITRPQMPERIVAYLPIAASLWDFGIYPVAIFGTSRKPDGTPEVYAGSVDLDAVESLGEEYGSLDLEALVAAQADLFINDMWADPPDVWGLQEDTIAQVNAISPIVQIEFVHRPITETIGSIEKLAAALGADLDAPAVTEARAAFAAASDELRAAIAEKPGLTVMFASGTPEEAFYVGNPSVNADLLYFKELGLDIVQPDTLTLEDYFEELSWEQAGKYPADLIFLDARQWSATAEELTSQVATFAALSAARANQFGDWQTEYVPSYAGFTPVLEALTEAIRNADPDIV
jgi:iron complex transport system substrate-binding protein